MKKLLSLPANEVHCFHETENVSHNEWFCTSDPAGHRLGSGGGTAWLLDACRLSEEDVLPLKNWLPKEKRILLHAGGQSRRLPAYAPTGKLLTPVPVFRWARGQRLSQNLLNLQLPLYQQIMEKAPESLHTLIASGDVFIRANEPLQEIPKADVVCFGLWADPTVATHHGVFISRRETPEKLDFMLQKPSLQDLATLASNYLCMLDIGIWLLSDRAVELLFQHAHNNAKAIINYELYSEFGLALGNHPKIKDEGLNDLSVAVLPLPGGEFYHFGTSHELISSTLAIQNLVRDQRAIMQRTVKPHPAMFVQNAEIHPKLQARNSDLWIENSCIGSHWTLHHQHVITGIPDNDWTIDLPAGTCMDAVPVGDQAFAARPYGFEDAFRGDTHDPDTLFLGRPFTEWMNERGLTEQDIPHNDDLQMTPLFPLCTTIEELGMAFRWMISEPQLKEGEAIWKRQEKLSANQLMDRANLPRLNRQRLDFRKRNWPLLAANHEKSVFYQLDLNDAAHEFAAFHLPLPAPLTDNAPLMKRIHDAMFRARTLQILHQDDQQQQDKAFELLRKGLTSTLSTCKEPHLNVYHDQIVWGRSPVRIDLAGGWTDTPPFCLYSGGNVVNVAIELNGQPPLQVYIKPSEKYEITLRSIDLGAREVVTKWEELLQFNKVGSPFTIPKAALALAGFAPERSLHRYDSLEDQFFAPDLSLRRYDSLAEQLRAFGSGIEITLLAAIPAGSGLGTSSILAATVLGTLSDFCGLGWDLNETGKRTLILEQLLTTGGGWQDQYGGILHGMKLLQTSDGFNQSPRVRWLPEYLFTDPNFRDLHLLYYTGITRTAKEILAEIVRGMFLNSGKHLSILNKMKQHAMDMYETIQYGDFEHYGRLVGKSWELNKALDSGTNPPDVERIIERIQDYMLGCKLPGAGGGGYLYIVAKDAKAAAHIRRILNENPLHSNARFVEMNLSGTGLQISHS